ncbi:MAG: hypothetical protein V4739_14855 [Pseudomonadota bacterium]
MNASSPNFAEQLKAAKAFDDQRPSFRGEHWLTLGAGLALLMASASRPSLLGRAAALTAGGALLVRAASGRDGLAKLMRR